ncbi:putative triose or hexose phosphate/phosphate translocator [Babesia divergens]|uniref:Triose or hexose phosphate/phosphate translocator n=1 Tax=Babesia divergens TaxID=32595 RepID=A0AAD9LGN8_BABDI|nr:putative triose or hexose phosphate/phosphate translocator [Babesia divergens]
MVSRNKSKASEDTLFSKISEEESISALPTTAFVEKRSTSGIGEFLRNFDWWLAFGFLKWYAMNAAYVVFNKRFLNAVKLPWTLSAYQLLVGWLFMILFWGCRLRAVPHFESKRTFLKTFIPLGFLHFFVHVGAVISMGLGAVSFTHVVKAGEPVITAIFSIIFLREILNKYAYLSLIPVVVGVSLSSLKELDFNIWAFLFAMLSNVFAAGRSVLAKITMHNKADIGENLTSSNIYLLLTLVASIMSIPFILAIEAKSWVPIWTSSTSAMTNSEKALLLLYGGLSGVFYFLANDGAFYCLGEINQVSYSVANTAKRVVIITVSIIVFKNKIELLGYVGMTMAVLGTFFYSIAK